MLSCTGLREKSVECIVTSSDGLVARHLTIWLNAMLEAEELPACISDLDTTLTEVQAQNFTHG